MCYGYLEVCISEKLFLWHMDVEHWTLEVILNVVILLFYILFLFKLFVILPVIYSNPGRLFINEVARINNGCHESQIPNFSHARRFKNHARVNLVSDLVIFKFFLFSRLATKGSLVRESKNNTFHKVHKIWGVFVWDIEQNIKSNTST